MTAEINSNNLKNPKLGEEFLHISRLDRVIRPQQPEAVEASYKASLVSNVSSRRASIRRMNGLLAPAPRIHTLSPTERFIGAHSLERINQVLHRYQMDSRDLQLFKKIMTAEKEGFLGYQAGSSTIRLFQDLIGMVVKHVLEIPVKDDFVFTRVPGDPNFHYEKAADFLNAKGKNIPSHSWDTQPDIRQHILSLNMNLYQSYDAPWDLTPRYYLENATWTHANVRAIIKPFFESLGIKGALVDALWSQGLDLLPHQRGYILQFFDESKNYAFTKEHSYIAYSGGKPNPQYSKHEILFDKTASDFPQIRLVLGNQSTLNPFSSLSIKRYDCMTDVQRRNYESALRSLVEKLPFDTEKVSAARQRLLEAWKH